MYHCLANNNCLLVKALLLKNFYITINMCYSIRKYICVCVYIYMFDSFLAIENSCGSVFFFV